MSVRLSGSIVEAACHLLGLIRREGGPDPVVIKVQAITDRFRRFLGV